MLSQQIFGHLMFPSDTTACLLGVHGLQKTHLLLTLMWRQQQTYINSELHGKGNCSWCKTQHPLYFLSIQNKLSPLQQFSCLSHCSGGIVLLTGRVC